MMSSSGGQVDPQQSLGELRQGDVVRIDSIPYVSADGMIGWHPTPDGVAVITQTCDLVAVEKPYVHVAPVIKLSDSNTASQARSGRIVALVNIPELGEDVFTDLSVVSTLLKENVLHSSRQPGVKSDTDILSFGQRVGRKFSRFAFPDELVPWVQPLQRVAASKHGSETKPEGWAMQQVAAFRMECFGGWHAAPYELTLCMIMHPGVLPPQASDEPPPLAAALSSWLFGPNNGCEDPSRSAAEIATRLRSADPLLTAADRWWLWNALGMAWGKICRPPEKSPVSVMGAVIGGQIDVEVLSTEEFSFERYRYSVELDLDHLSPPAPR